MKCISIVQPWASLVILGAKRHELRSWATAHRGLLAIHASRRFPELARELCREEPFRSILQKAGYRSWYDLPRGAILGTVQLRNCLPCQALHAQSGEELLLGDFQAGRWAWELAEPVPLAAPLIRPGRLGIFETPDLELPELRECALPRDQ